MATYNEIADKIHGVYHQLRITLDGVVLPDKPDNVEFNNTVNDAGGLEVGTAYSSTLAFTIDEPTKDLSGAELYIEDGVRDSDGTFQYAQIGYFRVDTITNDRGTYAYTCYDRMAYAFSGQYATSLAFPTTDKAIIEEICKKCNVAFTGDLTAHTVDERPTGTNKTVLTYMLQLQGKNAFFDTDGTLKIKWYEKVDYVIDDSRIYSDGDASTAEKFTFGFVKNVRTVKKEETKYETQTEYDDDGNESTKQVPYTEETSEEQTYTAGTGLQGVTFQNPYMTQGIVNELYEKLNGFSYTPATFQVVGDFRIRPMTIITANTNNGISYDVPVMSVQHSCDGGLADIISAYGQSESASSLDSTSDTSRAMARYDADLAYLKTAIVNNLSAERAKVLYAEISELNATNAKVKNLDANTVKTKDLESEVAKFGYAKADELESTVANFGYAKASELEATKARVETLETNTVKTKDLESEVAKFGYAKADTVETGYAKIDFSNVKGQVVDNSMIKDAAIDDAKILGMSANKLTAGTIDASKINVTNLNADNITVGTINGKRIGDGSIDLDKLAQEVPTKEYLDSVESKLQDQIDGAIETFTGSVVPTLKNEPASLWIDDAIKKKHVGDVYYVVNATSRADGYCYRFANTGTEVEPVWEWALIKDSDVTKALQELINVQGDISGLKTFQTETSSWQTNTADEISSIKTRTTTIETTYSTKTEAESLASNAQKNAESTAKSYTDTATKDMATSTAVANAKKEAIETAAADATGKANTAKTEAISAAAMDAQSKADAAQAAAEKTAAADATSKANAAAGDAKKYADTVASTKVETTVFNEVKQTVDENSASITNMSKTLSTKADGSTVESLSNTVNAIKQTTDANSSSISSITKKVSTVENTANAANKNASDAINKANTANEMANDAKESAGAAETKATEAAESANTAGQKATAAAASASNAEKSATSAEANATSAATSATNAEKSATSASASASNAAKSAGDAKASADNAVETASGAVDTANTAKNTAENASKTASTAKESAEAAVTKTEELTKTVNTVKQTAESNTATISALTETVNTKADGSTVESLSNKTSQLEQSINGFKTTVQETYVENTTYSKDTSAINNKISTVEQTANKIDLIVESGSSETSVSFTDAAISAVTNQFKVTGVDGTTTVIEGGKLTIDDLKALMATIGGFTIGNDCIYSGVRAMPTVAEVQKNKVLSLEQGKVGELIFGLTNDCVAITKKMIALSKLNKLMSDGTFSLAGGQLVFDGKNLTLGSAVTLTWEQITDTDTVARKTDIPTGTKDLKNDAGFQTKDDVNDTIDGKGYQTEGDVNSAIDSRGYQTEDDVNNVVESKGYQTEKQVTQITKDTVTTEYVNALEVKAGSVDAENITGKKITGKEFVGCTGEFSGKVEADEFSLAEDGYAMGIDQYPTLSGMIAGKMKWVPNAMNPETGHYELRAGMNVDEGTLNLVGENIAINGTDPFPTATTHTESVTIPTNGPISDRTFTVSNGNRTPLMAVIEDTGNGYVVPLKCQLSGKTVTYRVRNLDTSGQKTTTITFRILWR